jgi:hypothetical protein
MVSYLGAKIKIAIMRLSFKKFNFTKLMNRGHLLQIQSNRLINMRKMIVAWKYLGSASALGKIQ